jgi:hypothetical protein
VAVVKALALALVVSSMACSIFMTQAPKPGQHPDRTCERSWLAPAIDWTVTAGGTVGVIALAAHAASEPKTGSFNFGGLSQLPAVLLAVATAPWAIAALVGTVNVTRCRRS